MCQFLVENRKMYDVKTVIFLMIQNIVTPHKSNIKTVLKTVKKWICSCSWEGMVMIQLLTEFEYLTGHKISSMFWAMAIILFCCSEFGKNTEIVFPLWPWHYVCKIWFQCCLKCFFLVGQPFVLAVLSSTSFCLLKLLFYIVSNLHCPRTCRTGIKSEVKYGVHA